MHMRPLRTLLYIAAGSRQPGVAHRIMWREGAVRRLHGHATMSQRCRITPRSGVALAGACAGRPRLVLLRRSSALVMNEWENLGVHPLISERLLELGFTTPTQVQSVVYPVIAEGSDTVMLGKTGSGKTLAYLLPVLSAMLREREGLEPDGSELPSQTLILAPNRELCTQVHGVLEQLLCTLPSSLALRASALTESDANGDLDVLVSTPQVALRSWRGADGYGLRGPHRVRWLVLDEADQLLAGSFKPTARAKYPVEVLMNTLKEAAKESLARDEDSIEKLKAAVVARRKLVTASKENRDQAREQMRRAKASFWSSKQFIFAGATMPNAGQRNTDLYLRKAFPLAKWVRTGDEHRELAQLRNFFVRVTPQQRAFALQQAITQGPTGRTLVFANTVATAEEAFATASQVRKAALFSKEIAADERKRVLSDFQTGKLPVLVCTGLAARGIDFVDVAHVVQYELATNVIEWVHRVGRTARNGNAGVATSLYDEQGAALAEAIKAATERGESIDHLFSRKRSLRKRMNRFGEDAVIGKKRVFWADRKDAKRTQAGEAEAEVEAEAEAGEEVEAAAGAAVERAEAASGPGSEPRESR